ncbi:Molybdopterin-binding protein [Halapricum desulfuricans]|uniref:Molybdopterin-binding protein n=2 Tax=Halapricum desulfuricans TaxID=2841257 RepID=A0A897NCL3_9EURY|nr:Molybdopterin-binding protein [Halapricum desulfuricans]
MMALSARNHLEGTVTDVETGQVMAEVVIELGDGQEVTSTITRNSFERLDIEPGDEVAAVIKASEVMVSND